MKKYPTSSSVQIICELCYNVNHSKRAPHIANKIRKKTVTLLSGTNITFHSWKDGEVGRKCGGCLTNLRSTVNCVVSCWNYPMLKFGLPPANKQTAQDWDTLRYSTLCSNDNHNNGCNNEIFCAPFVNSNNRGHPSFAYECSRSAHHLSRCVIIMVDRCNEIMLWFLTICPGWIRSIFAKII